MRALQAINPEFGYGEITVYKKASGDGKNLERGHVEAIRLQWQDFVKLDQAERA